MNEFPGELTPTPGAGPVPSGGRVPNEVSRMVTAYKPRLLDAAAWALAGEIVRDCVLAAKPQTVNAARLQLQNLVGYLAGPSEWDRSTTPDLSVLLTEGRIRDAYSDPSLGAKSTRRARIESLGTSARAIGVREKLAPKRAVLDLTATSPTFDFPPVPNAPQAQAATKVRQRIKQYTPRRLDGAKWKLAGPAVWTLVTASMPTTIDAVDQRVSALVGFLCDVRVWSGTTTPVLDELVTVKNITAHIQRTPFKSQHAKAHHQKTLLALGRAQGTVPVDAPLRSRSKVYDPFLASLVMLPVPVSSLAAARRLAEPPLVGKFTLDYIAQNIAEARDVTAQGMAGSTVWGADALVALAEVSDHPLGVTVTTSSAAGSSPVSKAPKSRRALLAAATDAHARATRAATVEEEGTRAVLPDSSAVSDDVRAAVARYVPLFKAQRGVWDTNRDVAERLVYAYQPSSSRNAQNICANVSPFLYWHATRGSRDPKRPLDLNGMFESDTIEAYLAASSWSDASRSGARSVLRRINKKLHPHRAPVSLSHQEVGAPYTQAECEEFVRLAWHQPSLQSQRRLAFVFALALGAGLDAQDLRGVRRCHISTVMVAGTQITVVTVAGSGNRSRTIPVRTAYVPLLERALAAHDAHGLSGDALVVSDVATTINMVSRVVGRAKAEGKTYTIKTARLRHTWLVAVMSSPVALADLLQAAGLRSARTLTDLLQYCPPADHDDVALALGSSRPTPTACRRPSTSSRRATSHPTPSPRSFRTERSPSPSSRTGPRSCRT